MNSKQNSKKQTPASDSELVERAIYEALRIAGEVSPESDTEIARLEDELDSDPTCLPESLRDPDKLLDHQVRRSSNGSTPFPVDLQAVENLSRAARDGGEISPEIEKRMADDREAAVRGKEEQR